MSIEQAPMESTDLSITASGVLSSGVWRSKELAAVLPGVGVAEPEEHGDSWPLSTTLAVTVCLKGTSWSLFFTEDFLRTSERLLATLLRLDRGESGREGLRGREQGRRAGTGDVGILVTPRSSTDEQSWGRSLSPNTDVRFRSTLRC